MDPLERAVPFPALKVAKQRAARRKILRDRPPLTPCAEDIEQSVDDLTDIDPALVSAALRGRNQRRDHCPLLVRQIARVSQLPPVVARPVLLGPHHRASANRQRQANHKGFKRFKKFEDGHSARQTNRTPQRQPREMSLKHLHAAPRRRPSNQIPAQNPGSTSFRRHHTSLR